MSKRRLALVATLAGFAFVAASPPAPAETRSRAVASACSGRYRVRAGDTLSAIARRFRTTVPALARANSMHPNAVLLAGRVIRVPAACAKAPVAPRAVRPSSLASSLSRAVAVPGTIRARTGVVVVDLASSTVVYALNPELPLEPASTEKLPVALTALQRLGASFRTYTAVFGSGSRSGSTWSGDLVLKGFGDPMLTSQGLNGLARAIRRQGITAITGGVVGDESYFDAKRTAPGWKASFAKSESPLLSALVADRGVLDGRSVDHPALAAAILFTRALQRAGVSVARAPRVGIAGADAAQLVRRVSPPLSRMLERMDTWSDNFIAEMLLKQLGARLSGSGSTAAGAAVVEATLTANAIPLGASRIVDGSGLSSLDQLTARALAATLETVWHVEGLRRLMSTFAVAGSTGTLRHRLVGVPGHELVRGKTGTTNSSSALAGFVGSRYAFAIICNGSPVNWAAAHALQDRVAQVLLARA
jgi:D-alanyl-D-alanine carboxypeptidase/D-alanyl-D-alanine-endopeptidase (penicillin-binding protein 4)